MAVSGWADHQEWLQTKQTYYQCLRGNESLSTLDHVDSGAVIVSTGDRWRHRLRDLVVAVCLDRKIELLDLPTPPGDRM